MSWSEMGWSEIGVFVLGGALIVGGVIAFIASLRHDWKAKQRTLRTPHHAVGRDCYRDTKGVTR
jgi:hypothetical protein